MGTVNVSADAVSVKPQFKIGRASTVVYCKGLVGHIRILALENKCKDRHDAAILCQFVS